MRSVHLVSNRHRFDSIYLFDFILFQYILFQSGIQSNILENLPKDSAMAIAVRVLMALVCVMTIPLLLVPSSQIVEKFLLTLYTSQAEGGNQHVAENGGLAQSGQLDYKALSTSSALQVDEGSDTDDAVAGEVSFHTRCTNRFCMVMLITTISISVPCFSLVISLLGCFTVTILCYIMPPLLHLKLVSEPLLQGRFPSNKDIREFQNDWVEPQFQYYTDCVFFCFGLAFCVFATSLTAYESYTDLVSGTGC